MIANRDTTVQPLPEPPDLPGYAWRPGRREDALAMYRMLLAVEKVDDRELVESLQDVENDFADPWFTADTDSLMAVTADGEIAALGRTLVNPEPDNFVEGWMWIEVHPDHRGHGLEESLLAWCEARNRQRLKLAPAHLPRDLRTNHQDTQHDRIALAERRGYQPIRRFYRMQRDLHQPIPDVPLPDGLTLRVFTPDRSRALMHAFNESFADHWGFHSTSEEEWDTLVMQRPSFRPDLTYLVMDGDQIAGHSINRVSAEENERRGTKHGTIGQLGVRRAWRKRGLATALLCASMQAFRREGLDYAELGVDSENLTGALRIYERVGFVVVKRFVMYSKPVE